jgi:large subunit ribosomal protein L23
MNEHLFNVLRAPHISEKSARLQGISQYVFEVMPSATKAEIKAAVEELFDVQVLSVNLLNRKGKARTFRNRAGMRSSKRKAYVRLADGQTIDVTAKP